MDKADKLKPTATPLFIKAIISPDSMVLGACLILQTLLWSFFQLFPTVSFDNALAGFWQLFIVPVLIMGLFTLCIFSFPKHECKSIRFAVCLSIIGGLFVFDKIVYPDNVPIFSLSIFVLLSLWLGRVISYLSLYSSCLYKKANMISDLPKDLKDKAAEAIKIIDQVQRSVSKAPMEYRRETPGLLHQVEQLLDKLLLTYHIIARLQDYRRQAAKDAQARIADSAFSHSSEVLEKMFRKANRILGLLHEMQGWVLIMVAGDYYADEADTSPVQRVKKITQELALHAAALDEIDERLGESQMSL